MSHNHICKIYYCTRITVLHGGHDAANKIHRKTFQNAAEHQKTLLMSSRGVNLVLRHPAAISSAQLPYNSAYTSAAISSAQLLYNSAYTSFFAFIVNGFDGLMSPDTVAIVESLSLRSTTLSTFRSTAVTLV